MLGFWTLWSIRGHLKAAARSGRVLTVELYDDIVCLRVLAVEGATFVFEEMGEDEETSMGLYIYPIGAVSRICIDNVERARERLLNNPENGDLIDF